MPDERPGKRHLTDNFAAFDVDPRRSGRRKSRWSLRPMHEASEGATADAAHFVDKAAIMRGLGRREPE